MSDMSNEPPDESVMALRWFQGRQSVRQAAEAWGVTGRQIRRWCKSGHVPDAVLLESEAIRVWLIPAGAPHPGPLPSGRDHRLQWRLMK